jgi:glycerol-3-phosphate dehydrogenase (NAD(P)+)
MTQERVAVVGAGSWGTALASVLAGNGQRVTMWSFEPDVTASIQAKHENSRYLPGVPLPESLAATNDLAEAMRGAQVIVSVSPSQFVRRVMTEAAPHMGKDAVVVSASKGIEISTLERMDTVLTEVLGPDLPGRFAVLSGPSFALEVARGQPTAVVVASESHEVAEHVQQLFQTQLFRVYTNRDVVGVELGGALKNVIALASGTAAGLGFGYNALAALITRGLAEITRLGVTLGAQPSTFAGLAGLGDLLLTCTGELSRNRTVGYRLGRGETLEQVLGDLTQVAEGVKTAQAVHDLAHRHDVEMPITEEVYKMLVEGKAPMDAMQSLMARDPKPEESWS